MHEPDIREWSGKPRTYRAYCSCEWVAEFGRSRRAWAVRDWWEHAGDRPKVTMQWWESGWLPGL